MIQEILTYHEEAVAKRLAALDTVTLPESNPDDSFLTEDWDLKRKKYDILTQGMRHLNKIRE